MRIALALGVEIIIAATDTTKSNIYEYLDGYL